MKKRKRKYYESYEAIKNQQQVTRHMSELVHDWEIDDLFINGRASYLNKKRRTRIGFIETRKRR